MKILFIEPPKAPWFIMGEYIPSPLGLLCLVGYLEAPYPDAEIHVMDCQAEEAEWEDVEKRIETFHPDLVAPSTDYLTREEVQNELFATYRSFYGWRRRIFGIFARNKIKRTYCRHMMLKGFLGTLKGLFRL